MKKKNIEIVSNMKEDTFLKIVFKNGESEVVRIPSDGSEVSIKNRNISDIKLVRNIDE